MSPSTVHTSTGIRCGNRAYHGTDVVYHANAASVRECYANTGQFSNRPTPPATARYEAFEARSDAKAAERLAEHKAEQARQARNARYATWRTIPVYTADRGYYAIEIDGDLQFFRVERPSKGKHQGKTFVSRQSGDTFDKMSWTMSGRVLDAIAADPETANVLYGQKIGRCARCRRSLTDDKNVGSDGLTSLQRGVGPECAKKEGR